MSNEKISIILKLVRNNKHQKVKYKYKKRALDERPMALDVLLQIQENKIDDLAFRYGCRARNCGVCTVNINNKPRLACRARIKEGDEISSIETLPIIKDFIVKRDKVSRQMNGFNNLTKKNDLNVKASDAYHSLTACIECYACLDGCPMHAKNNLLETNNIPYEFGNPFSLLKLQRLHEDPLTNDSEKKSIIDKAKDLGLESCLDCPGCKCGVGIDLKKEVIQPLLSKAFK